MANNSYVFKNPAIVQQIEAEYPETTAEYMKIVMESYETFCQKHSNYGPSNISVGTNTRTKDEIKLSLSGLFFRLNDKISRIKQLMILGKQDNVGETIDDTFQDLGVYAIIAQIVKRGKWGQ
jgi:hypothetical protein